MSYLVLFDTPPETEYTYQALDYCKLLNAFVETSVAKDEKVKEYLGKPNTVELDKARGFVVLCFRALTIDEISSIRDDNTIVFFSEGEIPPSTVLAANIIDCFVAFGSRSAYKLANRLRNLDIEKPVYKINPWVDIKGIKQYKSPPIGKVSGSSDMALRSALRLMASGAVVVVPNQSPFTDIIVDKWNGLVFKGAGPIGNDTLTEMGSKLAASQAKTIAQTAVEFSTHYVDHDNYKELFESVLGGHSLDHNEPWIEIVTSGGSSWIIPKERMGEGSYSVIPEDPDASYKIMKPLTLKQLLDYFSKMRFKNVFVFDILDEEVDVGFVNKHIRILGDRVKNIFFCLDKVPGGWSEVSSKLTFMPVSEALKQIS